MICTDEMMEIPPIEDDMPFLDERYITEGIDWYSWIDEIKVVLDEGAIMPTRAHENDAGFDLYMPTNQITKYLWRHDSLVIDTGVHLAIPKGYCGIVISKSGLNTKQDITSHGLVDSGYTGSIKIKLYNHGDKRWHIKPGDKISQIVIMPCMTPKLKVAKKLPNTDRGNNGFGSSGR